MVVYEYKILHNPTELQLNELASYGWRIVSVVPVKRLKPGYQSTHIDGVDVYMEYETRDVIVTLPVVPPPPGATFYPVSRDKNE